LGTKEERTGYTALGGKPSKSGTFSFKDCLIESVGKGSFITDEDGLIGPSIFSMFLVTIDFEKMVLKLDPLPKHKAVGGCDLARS